MPATQRHQHGCEHAPQPVDARIAVEAPAPALVECGPRFREERRQAQRLGGGGHRLKPRLELVIILAATPIGNLGDASRRLVEALESATVIAAEDTRTTVRLLSALGVANRPRLVALHDHNEKQRAAELVELAREQDVLLLSDAGMPTVSDPGYGVVAAAAEAGVVVTAIPGTERGADSARGVGPADRPLHLRGVPAAQAGGAAGGTGGPRARAAHDGVLRVAGTGRGIPGRHGRDVRRGLDVRRCAAN